MQNYLYNTISLCFFYFFLIIDLIPAVIAQVFKLCRTRDSYGKLKIEIHPGAEIEIHPVNAEDKIRKCLI